MTQDMTIWGDILRIHEKKLLLPLLGILFPGFAILFGFIYERTFYAHFAINILDYTTYSHFLSVPFREPGTALWAAVATFVALISIRLVLGGRYSDQKLLYQLREFLVAIVILYAVYLAISNAATSAASSLPRVSIELQTSIGEEVSTEEYLMIGRVEDSLFFCENDAGNTVVYDGADIVKMTILPGDQIEAEACWRDIEK